MQIQEIYYYKITDACVYTHITLFYFIVNNIYICFKNFK